MKKTPTVLTYQKPKKPALKKQAKTPTRPKTPLSR